MYSPRVASVSRSQSSSTRRRSSSLYTYSPISTPIQSRSRSSSRPLQSSQIIEEIPSHIVETFGVPLPVLVTEVLTIQDRIAEMSVKLSESGWAWLVCGRRLFIWRFTQSVGPPLLAAQCREVTLPPSDLAHKADLVSVFCAHDSNTPSAIAVSPEGTIRYWPNIAHEGSSIEISAELHGQECFSLTDSQPIGFILATTTSTLVLVSPQTVDGQSTINCRQLKIPQGVLTGIGRRMSSFIFGSMPNQCAESKLVKVLVCESEKVKEKICFVLTGNNLQQWLITTEEPDRLVFEFDIDRLVKENLLDTVWGRDIYQVNQIQTWLIDMQLTKDGICVLSAGMNVQTSTQLYYSFGCLKLIGSSPPISFSNFVVAKLSERYRENEVDSVPEYKFVLSAMNKAYMYIDKLVYCMSISLSNEEPDKVEFRSNGDRLLGSGTYNGLPLFFSNNIGIVSLKPVGQPETAGSSFIDDEKASKITDSTSFLFSPRSDREIPDDEKISGLKEAFLYYCKGNQMECQRLLEYLYPTTSVNIADVDTTLNTNIAHVSIDLVDDYPASDPRWAESMPQDAINASSSLIVLNQLEDKQKAHCFYVDFLKENGLWNRLSVVKERDGLIPTRLLLREHAEKLVAAIALKNLHLQYDAVIESAIKIVLEKRNEIPTGKLTNQDYFYRRVSAIQDIVSALKECETVATQDNNNTKQLIAVNTILQTMFQESCQYRESNSNIYQIPPREPDTEYIPWLSTTGNLGIRTLLLKQYEKTTAVISQGVEDVYTRGTLYQQLLNLADLVLNGYCIQLESISNTGDGEHYRLVMQRYQVDRNNLIRPLLDAKQYDRAAVLAEKYCDFGILVQMCEETKNEERLQRYMTQFAEKDFSDFVFKWYLKEGKRGKLLSQPVSQHGELQRFLGQHQSLSWLHDIKTRKYNQAQTTLQNLALNEKSNLAKKKTLLSLSKLTALVSEMPEEKIQEKLSELNREQELILHQESLPAVVLENFGFDPDNVKVMSAAELIELYICPENVGSNEYDFKKALDLLQYLDKDSSESNEESLKLHIWCAAILRDRWSDMDMNNPLDSCQETIFFKTIDLIFTEGVDLNDYLPTFEDIVNADELGDLRNSEEFRFFIQVGYERIRKLML